MSGNFSMFTFGGSPGPAPSEFTRGPFSAGPQRAADAKSDVTQDTALIL